MERNWKSSLGGATIDARMPEKFSKSEQMVAKIVRTTSAT